MPWFPALVVASDVPLSTFYSAGGVCFLRAVPSDFDAYGGADASSYHGRKLTVDLRRRFTFVSGPSTRTRYSGARTRLESQPCATATWATQTSRWRAPEAELIPFCQEHGIQVVDENSDVLHPTPP